MTLVRWNPFGEFVSLQDRMNRMFDFPTRFNGEESGSWLPSVDIFEEGDNLRLQAELPGLKKGDIDIQIEKNVLTLKGERKREKEFRDENSYRLERLYGNFSRSFHLPVSVDPEKISASYRDGILDVTLPKSESSKTKKIPVSTN